MGWFSADEIVAPTITASAPNGHHVAQTIALCVMAGVAVGYILAKSIIRCHRQQTERAAERTARLATLPA